MKLKKILFLIFISIMINNFPAQSETYLDYTREFPGPQSYKDLKSNILFYVESDGRHVVAIDESGKILWHRNPFVEAKLEPYRIDHPVIVYIGPANISVLPGIEKEYIGISFDSSQFGVINIKTGDFQFLGQD